MLFDGKFNEDSKNVLKIVIFPLQVGFTSDFATDCPLSSVSNTLNFDTVFLPDCTKFLSAFPDYLIGNLMRIPKMCLK